MFQTKQKFSYFIDNKNTATVFSLDMYYCFERNIKASKGKLVNQVHGYSVRKTICTFNLMKKCRIVKNISIRLIVLDKDSINLEQFL